MSVVVDYVRVRQSEADYRYAEYRRRVAEEETAWAVWSEVRGRREVATDLAVGFRELFLSAGLNPFKGDQGVVEQRLWDASRVIAREQEYAAGVWRSKAALRGEAWARYMEVL